VRRPNLSQSPLPFHMSTEFRTPSTPYWPSRALCSPPIIARGSDPGHQENRSRLHHSARPQDLAELVDDLLDWPKRGRQGELVVHPAPFGSRTCSGRCAACFVSPDRGPRRPRLLESEGLPVLERMKPRCRRSSGISSPTLSSSRSGAKFASGRTGREWPSLSFFVSDHGDRHRPGGQERIFEQFTQVDQRPAAASVRGTGLGLRSDRKLAGLLGGASEWRAR